MLKKEIYFAGDFFIGQDSKIDNYHDLFGYFINSPLLINLEGAFVEDHFVKDKFKAVPLALHNNLLDVVPDNIILSLANNHSTDFGLDGLNLSRDKLQDRAAKIKSDDIFFIGSQRVIFMVDSREWCKPKDLGCFDFKLSMVKKMGDISNAIIYIHGGLEYRFYPSPLARKIAHLLVDNGAKAVIFHHSHIKGAIELYNERYIFYGLGNFLFTGVEGLHGYESNNGLVVKLNMENGNFYMSNITYSDDTFVQPKLDFKKITASDVSEFPVNYKSFYKKKYSLDSSLRPRQLDRFEWMVDIKYFLWNFFSKVLLRFGLTTKIKRIIGRLFG
ncbi:CapA family protein [bacterium]|nr:CapA family protein [bacterium]